ncbi:MULTISPECIES: PLP-dependent aminotransferase family protein [Pseudomonas aeruginosa group]|uniref:MocR-like pyridoxine biosynthesis transcription factor PdxR n=1 Tax=Pseudomonas aeruginosa group TaxID=136841 RepID=UPI0006B2A37A|nr:MULTISPECIES: PLP-dependent aminotransferase family protein [Pseudomonas aeruginosa group]KPD26558.1 transcriptional regulator [Pseudomonas paraeruginosa]KQB29141.1 transcriptional regulator [Pseudomonas paraeruginosa]MDT1024543.1 PLP-dependent aminotransferase family protein [Pseudomonas paraeruginosa]PHJ29867.1 PLP-dependent aminotransferase family protein [Pseudomonas paraeruginosa]QQV51476.1 PLP-dependent aminotransferase family protein [Pseudomonas aeruginosa]
MRGIHQLPLLLERGGKHSLQQQLLEQLRGKLLTGVLRPGQQLPPIREFARSLGVARNTVLQVYEHLSAEGYILSHGTRGTFVADPLPDRSLSTCQVRPRPATRSAPTALLPDMRQPLPESPGVTATRECVEAPIDFSLGRPSAELFPQETWFKVSARQARRNPRYLTDYAPSAGDAGLRQCLAEHLGRMRGIGCDAEDIVIVSGIQEALSLIVSLLPQDGRPVVVESPGYAGACNLFAYHRRETLPVAVDDQGLCAAHLPERACALAYVTPSRHYPLGMTLSLERRRTLLAWAQRQGAYILEDDYDGDFRYQRVPLPALKAFDHERVIYLGTFSKSLGAGLRLGYVVCPPGLREAMVRAKALLNHACPWLPQVVLADFLRCGAYAAHLRLIRGEYRRRRDCLIAALERLFPGSAFSGVDCGMHLCWQLPPGLPSAHALARACAEEGIRVYTLDQAAAVFPKEGLASERLLLLGYAALSLQHIACGIQRIARIAAHLERQADNRPSPPSAPSRACTPEPGAPCTHGRPHDAATLPDSP